MSGESQVVQPSLALGENLAAAPVVLLVGAVDLPELREVHRGLESLAAARRIDLHTSGSLPEALAAIEAGLFPDLIVLVQSRPSVFADDQLDALRRLAPTAGIVGIAGTWCEGEGRSGRPWPGAVRWQWHQAATRLAREIERMLAGACPSWGLPSTATADDQLFHEVEGEGPGGSASRRAERVVAIASAHRAMEETLRLFCRELGMTAVGVHLGVHTLQGRGAPATTGDSARLAGLAAAIWDGSDAEAEELQQLAQFIALVRPAPVIVLLSFPRAETMDRLAKLGVAAVLAKPLLLADLEGQMERLSVASGAPREA
ncbi:MAG: hypothetical protein HYS13_05335 [Planctomycetia bacterium]|nr:hypothetical protein [Planctomycetia bacterium]